MRVLVTGATTPFGVALVERLLAESTVDRVLAVVPPVRAAPGSSNPDALMRLDPERHRLQILRADLTRNRDVRTLLFGPVAEAGVDVLVHGATHRARHGRAERAHALNVDATRQVLELAEGHPTLRRFVYRSYADVYRIGARQPSVILENHPLELFSRVPPWVQDRMEADLTVCTRMGYSGLQIVVLRSAECLAPGCGSQLFDFLCSRVCFTPMGFDPMLNVLSVADLADACLEAARAQAQGVFNVPGADTLPLSEVIFLARRRSIPVPGPTIGALYGLRALVKRTNFRYFQNYYRFHFGGILEGRRARQLLGFVPARPVDWVQMAQWVRAAA